jgi:glycerate dehydrogenase
MNAVFLDYDTVANGDLDPSALREAAGELVLCDWDEARTAERLRDAQIVLTNKVELTRGLLRDAPRLKLIAVAGTGTNNIDVAAAAELGIGVCNVRGYCTASVIQHTWSLILSLTQHLGDYARLGGGSWTTSALSAMLPYPIRELAGGRFGVIGWGELGQGAARIAEAFGMRILIGARRGENPMPGRVPLPQLLALADIVSLHCPLNEQTRGLIGARELSLMKRDALLINTARGALVDGAALAAALKAGLLGGAGIDVLPDEPPRADDPLLAPGIPRLLITPHIAWAAREARQRCLDEMAANIRDFLHGGRRSRIV